MELGHLLTRSGLTYPEVSSKVCHDSFCQLGNSVSLPWEIYYVMYRNLLWYVPNTILHTDLQITTVKVEITNFSTKYREKLITHPNELIPALLEEEEPRRLKRFKPTELTTSTVPQV